VFGELKEGVRDGRGVGLLGKKDIARRTRPSKIEEIIMSRFLKISEKIGVCMELSAYCGMTDKFGWGAPPDRESLVAELSERSGELRPGARLPDPDALQAEGLS
jgi:hypothetical protein